MINPIHESHRMKAWRPVEKDHAGPPYATTERSCRLCGATQYAYADGYLDAAPLLIPCGAGRRADVVLGYLLDVICQRAEHWHYNARQAHLHDDHVAAERFSARARAYTDVAHMLEDLVNHLKPNKETAR